MYLSKDKLFNIWLLNYHWLDILEADFPAQQSQMKMQNIFLQIVIDKGISKLLI